MADIKLFRIADSGVTELPAKAVAIEKSLQTLIERHLEPLLGVRFLASEYSTGKTHGGRIDTLGLDENGFPVIIEYKRASNESIINQGLFYLDWLMDHRAEFEKVVRMHSELGPEYANKVEWSNPRLLCIAGDFSRYDEYAVQQIDRTIELIRYRKYEDGLLLLELVNATVGQANASSSSVSGSARNDYKTVEEYLEQSPESLKDIFHEQEAFIQALGDDVQKKTLKYYFAYKRIKNFVCTEVHPQSHTILTFVKINPDTVELEDGFTRDVRNIGHYGTGDLEIRINTRDDLERAKPLIEASYAVS